MSNPLLKTLEVLTTSGNPLTVDVLIAGLHVPDDTIRIASLGALLKRHSTRGNIEIIKNLHHLTSEMRSAVERSMSALGQALRQGLMHGDPELRRNALEMVVWFEDFSQFPTLLNLLEDENNTDRGATIDAVQQLIDRLYEHLTPGRHKPHHDESAQSHAQLRDAERVRRHVLTSLESACRRYEAHHCPVVVEGTLALAGPDPAFLKKLLHETSAECGRAVDELIHTSTHPGVLSLIVDMMGLNYPHSLVLAAFEERDDVEFICHLLRNWPRTLSAFQQKNFKSLKNLPWLQPARLKLELIPPALQPRLVEFVQAGGLPQEHRLAVLEWLVKHGTVEGRLAATDVLVGLEGHQVQDVIIDGLKSAEPDIQAWATSQLRAQGVPGAFEMLIQRLDSPLPEVREVARTELGAFDVQRVLEMYEHLDTKTCAAVGRLLQKIDPHALDKLQQEMSQSIRRKRIRAARAALALGVHERALDGLLIMVQDSDALVRRTAVEVLAHLSSPVALETLTECLNDPSIRVREAATRSLRSIHERLREPAVHEPETAPAATADADRSVHDRPPVAT